jgi:MFS family permease
MWLLHTSVNERRALTASFLGYGLDGFDLMMYSFIIPTLLSVWHLSNAQAGYIATAALITSGIGGWAGGVLADRYGRARMLQLTVLWFAAFTFLSGFTQSFGQLLAARALQGFGFGGEWAVGSILVAEIVDARHRGKAAGLVQSSWSVGWAAAALSFWAASAALPPALAWRAVCWIGFAPALLIVYIRRNVTEPPVYLAMRARQATQHAPGRLPGHLPPSAARHEQGRFLDILRSPLLRTTCLATLLSTGMMSAYYSLTSWLPTFLSTERHLTAGGTTGYLLMVIVGSFAGYLTCAWLTDAIGRRRGFICFALCAAGLTVLYTQMPISGGMLLLGFLLGFFGLGIFSAIGAFMSELYPSEVRGSGAGFSYSVGRGIGGVCPLLIGKLSGNVPLGDAICGFAVAAYALVVLSAFALPETRGKKLTDAALDVQAARI